MLERARSLVFISPHESQGFRTGGDGKWHSSICMDHGFWFDPDRHKYGPDFVPATSVPFFDERLGDRFGDLLEFYRKWPEFWEWIKCGQFDPVAYVSEHLRIVKSTKLMLTYVRMSIRLILTVNLLTSGTSVNQTFFW